MIRLFDGMILSFINYELKVTIKKRDLIKILDE